MKAFALAGLVVLLAGATSRAGIYNAEEPFNFEIDSEGFARPIQYSGGFESILKEFRQADFAPRGLDLPINEIRKKYLDRVHSRQEAGVNKLLPEELASYTADLLRLRMENDALNLLQPLARDPRRGGFFANAHLAMAHAYRGEWREAADQEQQALLAGFPESFAKLTKPQLTWLKRVEREYYLPLLTHRAEEARGGKVRERREAPDAIFGKRGMPGVQFVGEDGKFTPGKIAAAEREKLPRDAMAIVQQLLFWHPRDARLFWLLGELYNAEGEVETAATILDECSYAMSYTNPSMMEHRQALKEAAATIASARAAEVEKARQVQLADEQRQADEKQRQDDELRDRDKRTRWIIIIAVALGVLLVYYQSREFIRRLRRTRKAR
jgi:hypothetical protein